MSDVLTAPALRARSAPQLLDALFAVARGHAWDLFALGVLLHLPVHVFRVAGAFAGSGSLVWRMNPEFYIGSVWWSIWNPLAVTVTAVATCQVCLDGHTSIRRALEGMREGGWRLLGTVAAVTIILDGLFGLMSTDDPGGILLLFIPLSIAIVWCAPAIPAAAVEKVAPWTAIRRALWLVRRNFWRVALVVWIVWAVTFIADSELVNFAFSLTHRGTVSRVVDVAVDGALYPLRGIAIALVYLDCRVRREAFDLERMLRAE